jgi:hypothetical protein
MGKLQGFPENEGEEGNSCILPGAAASAGAEIVLMPSSK